MSKFLTEVERTELLEKYKNDNLRDAPANIKDETLIKNYGSDEQNARLSADEPGDGEEQKGEKNPGGDETGVEGNETGKEITPSDKEQTKEFTAEYNRFVSLHGKAPAATITTAEELRELNDKTVKDAQEAEAAEAEGKTPAAINPKGAPMIRLKNKKTGAAIYVTVFTYENYTKKTQPEWEPAPVKPIEVRGKK